MFGLVFFCMCVCVYDIVLRVCMILFVCVCI